MANCRKVAKTNGSFVPKNRHFNSFKFLQHQFRKQTKQHGTQTKQQKIDIIDQIVILPVDMDLQDPPEKNVELDWYDISDIVLVNEQDGFEVVLNGKIFKSVL